MALGILFCTILLYFTLKLLNFRHYVQKKGLLFFFNLCYNNYAKIDS